MAGDSEGIDGKPKRDEPTASNRPPTGLHPVSNRSPAVAHTDAEELLPVFAHPPSRPLDRDRAAAFAGTAAIVATTPAAAPAHADPTRSVEADWPLGTHLVSPRRGYQHHGLYAGHGRVIHYAGFNRLFRRGPVEEVSIDRFARGQAVRAWPHATPAFAGQAAVQRARSRLGEDRYRFWSNNCEHLVHWALHGTPRSSQVERLVGGWRQALRRLAAIGTPTGGRGASVSNATRHAAAKTGRTRGAEMMPAMEAGAP